MSSEKAHLVEQVTGEHGSTLVLACHPNTIIGNGIMPLISSAVRNAHFREKVEAGQTRHLCKACMKRDAKIIPTDHPKLKDIAVGTVVVLKNKALGTHSGISASYNIPHDAGTKLTVVKHNAKSVVCRVHDEWSAEYRFKPDTAVSIDIGPIS